MLESDDVGSVIGNEEGSDHLDVVHNVYPFKFSNKKEVSFAKTNENLTTKFLYENTQSQENISVLSPLQYFYRYVPPQLFIDMAFYTNLYAT